MHGHIHIVHHHTSKKNNGKQNENHQVFHFNQIIPSSLLTEPRFPRLGQRLKIQFEETNLTQNVELSIFSLSGKKVWETTQGAINGVYKMVWDQANFRGKQVSPGIYFCQMRFGDEAQLKKILVLGN